MLSIDEFVYALLMWWRGVMHGSIQCNAYDKIHHPSCCIFIVQHSWHCCSTKLWWQNTLAGWCLECICGENISRLGSYFAKHSEGLKVVFEWMYVLFYGLCKYSFKNWRYPWSSNYRYYKIILTWMNFAVPVMCTVYSY